jgi:ribosomal protein S18 acetylase RimI-like enzyme
LIVLSYEQPDIARVVDAPPELDPNSIRTIVHVGGHLKYRLGLDSSVEIYDLFVDEERRRSGIGRKLVERLLRDDHHSVYAFTRVQNEMARAFYRAVGFREVIMPEFYRGGDAVFLHRVNPNGIAHCDPLT